MYNLSTQRSYVYKKGSGEDIWISMGMRNQINFIDGVGVGGVRNEKIRWLRSTIRLWNRIGGEKAGIEWHLKNNMEIWFSGNFLKYTKIIMKSPTLSGYSIPTGHLLSPNVASNSRTALHSTELLDKGISWKSPNNLSCQDKWLFFTNW